jgi:undecaprenyl diphosphate synthase
MESTLPNSGTLLHVAVIMDGNGRWAARRGRPRPAGHVAGARATRRVVESAAELGVGTLTLYAFSADNWRRPAVEVDGLLRLFTRYLAAETARCVANGVRLSVIGRRDRLPPALGRAIEAAEQATARGEGLHLRVALDYSARDAILTAAREGVTAAAPGTAPLSRDRFAELLGRAYHDAGPARDVDLLVRTGGEQRLSDFLLWECAYAELVFSPVLWPDFGRAELARALHDFGGRQRRFGAVSAAAAG